MTGSDSSKSRHPSSSRLPPSPSLSDLDAFADVLADFRKVLWPLSTSSPSTRASDSAQRLRGVLGEASGLAHDLRRALERDAVVRLVPRQD